ncbi:MAG: Glycosyl transferase GT2 family [Candidatus Moranbacteria bacterium GW2011_GWE1_35_17]|nr:MAG: Glycosyl transferase GT2 family [Candidatus Moranbacteria bacterium GW2011_GWE1_35_17]KKP82709.1 MAG: Glycosyl transferase GT2 family [Candidatus Moranbacteria bacterium GW2011_GWF1_35_5]KKP84011.1 MAG: Glycosyl transferase GT2 family [Candidatus Moranbacteria bacterium GW2011_GWF2_35_54]
MQEVNQENKIKISVVVPIYNEEGNVKELHSRIFEECQKLGKSFEIIFIDDGSKDRTAEMCEKLSPLKLIKFRKNYGQTAAFDAGFQEAKGEVIITMDGDLQNDPADMGKLLEKIEEGYDVVSGWRHKRKDSLSKKIFSRGANLLRKILIEDNIHDSGCSLKAYKRECFNDLELFGEMHRFIPALLEMDGFKVAEVKVSHHHRIHGVTKYNWKRAFKGFVDMVSIWFWRRFAARPLHLFGASGMILSILGGGILAWMFVEKVFLGASLQERIWPIIGVMFVLVGVQLFISGLLADILIKNYFKAKNHRGYYIKEISNN